MRNKKTEKFHYSYLFGWILTILGSIAIYIQILVNLLFILSYNVWEVPSGTASINFTQEILYIFFLLIGIPSLILFLFSVKKFIHTLKKGWGVLAFLLFIFVSFGFNASLIFGGGWYVGIIVGDIGLCALLNAIIHHNRNEIRELERLTDTLKKAKKISIRRTLAILVCIIIVIAGIIPILTGLASIPPSLMKSLDTTQEITPNHNNTFYILPIWETQGESMTDQINQLNFIKADVGGPNYTGNGFIRIGRSVSCWYTNNIYSNGTFNPSNLINDLEGAKLTNTPILFHMNGGNWGQSSSTNPVIEAMRENKSNCEWDQNNVFPPIYSNGGPNDRYWSLAPNTDWENYRHTNIEAALSIIYAWWQQNPDLLVGFSTDSEIHEDDNTFQSTNPGNYTSYFDYSPDSIAQFQQWAQANWTITTFNQICGTNFTLWSNVDAPRSTSIVGKVANPYWEMWTNFRIYQVQQAVMRQCKWIYDAGFPRDMIWSHQILSNPGDPTARYIRCDPIQTASNPYCQPGFTRYSWAEPSLFYSLGNLSIIDGSANPLPSWGLFEWNLWTQHEYQAYMDQLDFIYQYGGHVICPNEWGNTSSNKGLWIPGYNPQLIAALQTFINQIQNYPRGTSPNIHIHSAEIVFYNNYNEQFNYFNNTAGLIIMVGAWLMCLTYWSSSLVRVRRKVCGNENIDSKLRSEK